MEIDSNGKQKNNNSLVGTEWVRKPHVGVTLRSFPSSENDRWTLESYKLEVEDG